MGMFLEATPVSHFRVFRTLLEDEHDRPYLAELGKRGLALVNRDATHHDLYGYHLLVLEARDYWHARSDMWEELYLSKTARLRAVKRFVERGLPRRSGRPDR